MFIIMTPLCKILDPLLQNVLLAAEDSMTGSVLLRIFSPPGSQVYVYMQKCLKQIFQ